MGKLLFVVLVLVRIMQKPCRVQQRTTPKRKVDRCPERTANKSDAQTAETVIPIMICCALHASKQTICKQKKLNCTFLLFTKKLFVSL